MLLKNLHTYPESWLTDHPETIYSQAETKILVEYSAHPNACFSINGYDDTFSVRELEETGTSGPLKKVESARHLTKISVVEKSTGRNVGARLHLHGCAGEYLAPLDRFEQPSPLMSQSNGEFVEFNQEHSALIDGKTTLRLPFGNVFIQLWSGFEKRPRRLCVEITEDTDELILELEKELDWTDREWVCSDTHVHYITPMAALVQAKAEDINIIHLLALCAGEDKSHLLEHDGKTTYGSLKFGGDGRHLVRVGLEARQCVSGHYSLCGYEGDLILPAGSGGAAATGIGDPVDITGIRWARQCRKQNGLVLLSHSFHPRAESAALVVLGLCDGAEVELHWSDKALPDWYCYLNCGYQIPTMTGTDKMSVTARIGWMRTYCKLPAKTEFNLNSWKDAVRSGNTFSTHGPLLEFSVNGKPAGSRLEVTAGESVTVDWKCATLKDGLRRVELISEGNIADSRELEPEGGTGTFTFTCKKAPGWRCV